MIKAVIFDLDGVLVLGNEKFHIEAWDKVFKEFNLNLKVISEEYYREIEGMRGSEILDIILKENHASLPDQLKETVYSRKKKIFLQIVNPKVAHQAKSLLNYLKSKSIKVALATGNNRAHVEEFISKHFGKIFDVIVTGDDVKRGKPYPDLYDKAVEKLGLPKSECVVVENAPIGIASAKAAGLFVIGITSTLPAESLFTADKIISKLQEIKQFI